MTTVTTGNGFVPNTERHVTSLGLPNLRRLRTLCLTTLTFACATAQIQADTFYVGSTPAGCNAATLGAAILGATFNGSEDDEIRLTTDLTNIQQSLLNWDPATIGRLTIRGGYSSCTAPTSTGTSTVSGDASGPVFEITASGGDDSKVLLENLVIRGATDDRGITVTGVGAELDLINTDVQFNEGGLSVEDGARAIIGQASDISDNNGGMGGGIKCDAGTVFLAGSVSFNQAHTGGGLLAQSGCQFNLLDGAFVANNEALFGGGIALLSGALLQRPISFVHNFGVQINNNEASVFGGAVWTSGSTVRLHETWIRGNTAGDRGGAIYAVSASDVQMGRRTTECFSEPRCSWLEGNTIEFDDSDREGSAVFLAEGSTVALDQTFIESHGAVDDTGYLLFATGENTRLEMEGVQLANNTTLTLFRADDRARIVAAFVSAAGNSWDPGSRGTSSPTGASATGFSSILVRSSALWDHDVFSEDATSLVDLVCVMGQTTAGASIVDHSTSGVNPLFADVSGGDLQLTEGSAAIDYCNDETYSPSHPDLLGVDRGQDAPGVINFRGPFDLGAYEFQVEGPLIFTDGFESGNTSAWSSGR